MKPTRLLLFICLAMGCGPALTTGAPEPMEPAPVVTPPPPDAGVPAPDASVPPEPDAGAIDAGAPDAGTLCDDGLIANAGFECGLTGWVVLKGTARLPGDGASTGQASLELTADADGAAVVARVAPLEVTAGAGLCFALKARGTVAAVRLEVLTAPSNQAVTFTAPVTPAWTRVPPSRMRVEVPPASQVWILARAMGASGGEQLQLDDFEVSQASGASCPP